MSSRKRLQQYSKKQLQSRPRQRLQSIGTPSKKAKLNLKQLPWLWFVLLTVGNGAVGYTFIDFSAPLYYWPLYGVWTALCSWALGLSWAETTVRGKFKARARGMVSPWVLAGILALARAWGWAGAVAGVLAGGWAVKRLSILGFSHLPILLILSANIALSLLVGALLHGILIN